jgi:hypothetical protein
MGPQTLLLLPQFLARVFLLDSTLWCHFLLLGRTFKLCLLSSRWPIVFPMTRLLTPTMLLSWFAILLLLFASVLFIMDSTIRSLSFLSEMESTEDLEVLQGYLKGFLGWRLLCLHLFHHTSTEPINSTLFTSFEMISLISSLKMSRTTKPLLTSDCSQSNSERSQCNLHHFIPPFLLNCLLKCHSLW